jgi:hypothetical protein
MKASTRGHCESKAGSGFICRLCGLQASDVAREYVFYKYRRGILSLFRKPQFASKLQFSKLLVCSGAFDSTRRRSRFERMETLDEEGKRLFDNEKFYYYFDREVNIV